ncbi:PRR15 protein, partial [Atractosteus spatula]|nr:PRR15 protein [Atractosteus spatula]
RMAERSSWWKSFTLRKKNKDPATQYEGNPELQTTQDKTSMGFTSSSDSRENQHQNLIKEQDYEDSNIEPVFNEKTCRRNLKISRSGRFKEKSRVRATLPANNNFFEGSNASVKD